MNRKLKVPLTKGDLGGSGLRNDRSFSGNAIDLVVVGTIVLSLQFQRAIGPVIWLTM
jgi:hypothetical protein